MVIRKIRKLMKLPKPKKQRVVTRPPYGASEMGITLESLREEYLRNEGFNECLELVKKMNKTNI